MKEITDIQNRADALNLPMAALLSEAGVNPSTWWRWRRGKSSPMLGTIKAVYSVLRRHERQRNSR